MNEGVIMNAEVVCGFCGHKNQVGWKFCSQCGKRRQPWTAAIPFPTLVDIHPQADLFEVMYQISPSGILGGRSLSVDEFRQVCETHLSLNSRQCLYRRFQLNKPGKRPLVPWKLIGDERGSSGQSVKVACLKAIARLRRPIQDLLENSS